MTRALGTPQRGQTMAPEVERLAMEIFLIYLDATGVKRILENSAWGLKPRALSRESGDVV